MSANENTWESKQIAEVKKKILVESLLLFGKITGKTKAKTTINCKKQYIERQNIHNLFYDSLVMSKWPERQRGENKQRKICLKKISMDPWKSYEFVCKMYMRLCPEELWNVWHASFEYAIFLPVNLTYYILSFYSQYYFPVLIWINNYINTLFQPSFAGKIS